jgi:hypothetical protein
MSLFFVPYPSNLIFFIFSIYRHINMIIMNKGQQNELILNINNNSRTDFSGYTLTFTHILSQEEKSYVIPTSNPQLFAENIRYCEIILNLQNDDLNYEGQYQLRIYGNGTSLVLREWCVLMVPQNKVMTLLLTNHLTRIIVTTFTYKINYE